MMLVIFDGLAGDKSHALAEGGTARRASIAVHHKFKGEYRTEWWDLVVWPKGEDDWRLAAMERVQPGSRVTGTGTLRKRQTADGYRAQVYVDRLVVEEPRASREEANDGEDAADCPF